MKKRPQFTFIGLASVLCISALTACNGGFKSRHYTAEEQARIMRELKAKNKKELAAAKKSRSHNGPVDETYDPEGIQVPETVQGDQVQSDVKSFSSDPESREEGVKGKAYEEAGVEMPADRDQQVYANVAELKVTIEKELKAEPNQTASSIIKGFSFRIEGDSSARLLTLDSVFQVDGVDYIVKADKIKIGLNSQGQVFAAKIQVLKLSNQEEVSAGDRFRLFAICTDAECATIQSKLEIKGESIGTVAAIFEYQLIGDQWFAKRNNMTSDSSKIPTFAEAVGVPPAPEDQAGSGENDQQPTNDQQQAEGTMEAGVPAPADNNGAADSVNGGVDDVVAQSSKSVNAAAGSAIIEDRLSSRETRNVGVRPKNASASSTTAGSIVIEDRASAKETRAVGVNAKNVGAAEIYEDPRIKAYRSSAESGASQPSQNQGIFGRGVDWVKSWF